jgi:prepilin-type N-terminal cleavage/methylation domain-containing protein
MTQQRRHSDSGFTLAELLVALTIVIILTLIAIPSVQPLIKAQSVDGAANIVRAALMHSRNTAVAQSTEAYCWLAPGSVYESGTIAPPPSSTPVDIEIIIDNEDLVEREDPEGYWTCRFEKTSYWTVATPGTDYTWGASMERLSDSYANGAGDDVVTWHFNLARNATLKAYGYWAAYSDRGTVKFAIDHGGSPATSTVSKDQTQNGQQWVLLGEYTFQAGARKISLSDDGVYSKVIVADAVKLTGALDPMTLASNECLVTPPEDKTWTDDQWNGYHMLITNRPDGATASTGQSITGRITDYDSTLNKVTVASSWSPNDPPAGARFLIVEEDPSGTFRNPTQTVGSGTPTSARWTALPDDVEVCAKDPVTGNELVFPITFTRLGRARFSGDSTHDYITIKIRDKEEPENQDMWRFVRLYRNTGRTVIARKLSELP